MDPRGKICAGEPDRLLFPDPNSVQSNVLDPVPREEWRVPLGTPYPGEIITPPEELAEHSQWARRPEDCPACAAGLPLKEARLAVPAVPKDVLEGWTPQDSEGLKRLWTKLYLESPNEGAARAKLSGEIQVLRVRESPLPGFGYDVNKPEKLVRDRIEEFSIAAQDGRRFRKSYEIERLGLLARKLVEEAKEVRQALMTYFTTGSKVDLLEELGDLKEVILAIERQTITSPSRVEEVRVKKLEAKGGFQNGTVLECLTDIPRSVGPKREGEE
jgi:predicted house-cleaning noncanonical NTP pyrophosphatase (MazG superfamily)